MMCFEKINKLGRYLTLICITCSMTAWAQKDVTPSPALQLRTNGLFDLTACPNIGLEIQTDLGLAWQLDYVGAWWNSDSRHRYFSNYAFLTEIRYYVNHKATDYPFLGHHVGVYGMMATYDFEFGSTGYMSPDLDRTWSIGLSYGFSKKLNKKLSLDLTVGLGYFTSLYDVYEPMADNLGYLRTDQRRMNFFGPTKLEISLVWNLNYLNRP